MVSLSCSYMGKEGYVPAAYLRKIGSGRHSVKLQDTREKNISVASTSPGFSEESGECCGPCCLGYVVGTFQNDVKLDVSRYGLVTTARWRRRLTCPTYEVLSDNVSKMASCFQRSQAIVSLSMTSSAAPSFPVLPDR